MAATGFQAAIPHFGNRPMIYDFIIIGGGISGAAAAYELAPLGAVAVLEAETAPGYHSTGRSAALFTRNFGSRLVRKINASSEAFFTSPPEGFCQRPLLTPRGALTVAQPGDLDCLSEILEMSQEQAPIHRLTAEQTLEHAPILRPERVGAAAYEPGVTDIDVASLHQGYLRGLKHRGGEVIVAHRVDGMDHGPEGWSVRVGANTLRARTVINAAGAWADKIGTLAGAAPIGLVAKRRTGIIVDVPQGIQIGEMPSIDFCGTDAYIKPEAGKLMASPGDQTPIEPQDVRPDEMDVAILVDWLERETFVSVRRIAHSWAGLRSFVPDENPVVGFDPKLPGLFWLAAQGGYGIMMAPALARATASLATGNELPHDLIENGVTSCDLSPDRLAETN
jgi:D-arginine dehydrogenase